jgi:hypothetical protein
MPGRLHMQGLGWMRSTFAVPGVRLAFKFYPIKSVLLNCSEVHLIKVISNTKKKITREEHGANQMLK